MRNSANAAMERSKTPVVLRLRPCPQQTESPSRRRWTGNGGSAELVRRVARRSDVLILVCALPIFSLAVHLGWQMLQSRSGPPTASIDAAAHVRIEPIAEALDLPELSRIPPFSSSGADAAPHDGGPSRMLEDPMVRPAVDPSLRPMSASPEEAPTTKLHRADYVSDRVPGVGVDRYVHAARYRPKGGDPPIVRILSVEPSAGPPPTGVGMIPAPPRRP